MREKKIKPLILKTYISIIKKTIGSKIFRNSYFLSGEKEIDILKNGSLSCAFFVSSILKMFSLISNIHATVDGTIKDIEKNGWIKVYKPKTGSIVVWKATKRNKHKHIGFCVSKNKAISNNSKNKTPMMHPIDYRAIESFYWHRKLDN